MPVPRHEEATLPITSPLDQTRSRLSTLLLCGALLLALPACGAAKMTDAFGNSTEAVASAPSGGGDARSPSMEYERAEEAPPAQAAMAPPEPQRERMAAADGASPSDANRTATDASAARAPLLIYTARFQLSVFEVDKSQTAAKAMATAMGGFVSLQTQTAITVRIPAARFEEALAAIEHMGKVLARQIEALDVGERYRDLGLRLKTLEAMRQRLEELLARAGNVKEALEVEQQLERVLGEIEQLKGQLRSFDDRIAYSTLTLDFTPTPQPALDQGAVFRLPFPWLEELGIHSLLEVTP